MERRMLLSANLVWNPQAGSDVWDYSTPNWIDTASNMPTVFHDGDEVSFGDRGAGTVLIDANGVAPGSTTVDSSLDYSFNGAATDGTGGINGAGTLVKDGTGNLAVFNVNAYSGSTLVDAGSLAVDYGTLGSGDGTVTVADGATLELVRIDGRTTPQLSNPLVLNGMGVNSEGALVSGGSVNYLYSGPITAVSASKINSAQGGIELSGSIDDEAGLTLDGDGQTLIDGAVTGPGGINKVGTGTAVFGGPGKTYSGPTGVVSGTLEDGGGASGELSPNSRYTVAAGATLHDFGFDTIGSLAGAGTVTTVASITVGADNSDSTFSGVMTGGVIKIGTGTFTLAGDQPNGLSRLDISGGTVVLDKSDGVAAIEPQAQSINDGIYIESGGLRWAASNQLSPTEQIVGQPIGPADIDVGVYTDSCYSLSGGNGGTIHIGTGGALNVADFAISSYPVTWNIDQGAALNLLDGGAGYSDVARLGLVDATVNIAGTINIGNSPGLTAVVFDGGAAVVTPTGTINTGSGAVVFQSNIDIPADQNPPNLVVQSGGQMNLGRFGDNASLRLLGHQEGGAQVDQGSLLIESGATVNMEGAQSRIEELGGQDAITGTGTINLFGGNRTIDARGELIISANVINGTMTKIGNGPLALAGSNSFSGPSTIQAGILVLGSDPALANTTHVYVEDGATLDLNGHAVTAPIDAVGGGAPTGGGAIANFSRAFTDLGGPSAPATVRSTLTLGGSTSFAGDLPITLAGQVTGPGEITVADGGAVLVFTNSSNDYTGGTNNIPPNWGRATSRFLPHTHWAWARYA